MTMKNRGANAAHLPDRAAGLRAELARKIAFFIGLEERRITDVPGLTLSRLTGPTTPASGTYEPSLAVVARGENG